MENKQEKNIGNFVEGEYLITIHPDYVGKENIENKLKTIEGVNVIRKFTISNAYQIKINPPEMPDDIKKDYISTKVKELKGLEYILDVEPVGKVQALDKKQDYKENLGKGFNII